MRANEHPDGGASRAGRTRVLVVDDDPDIISELFEDLLERDGRFEVARGEQRATTRGC
jgi:DNA-binding NtrC family response regulator